MLYLEHISLNWSSGAPVLGVKDKMGRPLSLKVAIKKAVNRVYNYFLDMELLLLRVIGFIPIFFIRKFFFKLAGVKIGSNSHIHMGVQFFNPANVQIGKGTIIGANAFLDGRANLKIGDHVDIASDVMIYNSEHDINSEDFKAKVEDVEIGDYVFIGPRAIILPGVKIGKGAVVAAGAVVVKNVGEFSIVGGVPAHIIGERKLKNPQYKLGRARLFQ
ncbi:acyltransferase [Candidatus Daviesbacteria bacterium]|nr:acyltransferase [Candidatus Daviesbacteria bacterium]